VFETVSEQEVLLHIMCFKVLNLFNIKINTWDKNLE